MVRNTNDGSDCSPYLKIIMNMGNLRELPDWSQAPKAHGDALYAALKEAGYDGTQAGDLAACQRLGMSASAGGRVNAVGEIEELAARWKDEGYDCSTLHVAWGIESDDEVIALVSEIIEASERYDFPLYIETHRATLTQDMWRTVQLTQRLPQVRFNGDFSHWYTGLEMPYGGFDKKLEFIEPVLDRIAFFHGRIGNPSHIQVEVDPKADQPFVAHFKQMWTRGMEGFLRTAKPGDYLCFAPELLPSDIFYARMFRDEAGNWREETDRWQQALLLSQIARECFAAAQARIAK